MACVRRQARGNGARREDLEPLAGRSEWWREPVLMALGDPVRLPKCEKPTPEQVDEGHKAMLAGFAKVFETHKVAYGWPDKELRFV